MIEPADGVEVTVYSNDFEGAVGPERSSTSVDTTPAGARRFLGQFGNESVTLTLADLPPHTQATVSFDLYIIRSWDGNNETATSRPEVWDLNVASGPTLFHTSFANNPEQRQAYPGTHPDDDYALRAGAMEHNSLAYFHFDDPMDAVYRLSSTVTHSGSSLALNFSGSGLQELGDESWGLDNVVVGVIGSLESVTAQPTASPPTPTSTPTPTPTPIPPFGFGTAAIDGRLSLGEWDNAVTYDFPVNVSEGGTTPGTLLVMNDESNLYLAVRFARTTVEPRNLIFFSFDNHNDGVSEDGDDYIRFDTLSGFEDWFMLQLTETSWSFPRDINPPEGPPGTYDGDGAFANNGTFSLFEISKPLDSADDAHDFSLSPGDTIGFSGFLRMIPAGAELSQDFGETRFPIGGGEIAIVSPNAAAAPAPALTPTPTPLPPTATSVPTQVPTGVSTAQNFTVNSTADAIDANTGDGVCDDGSGNCTLRAAIMEAIALAGAEAITLPTGTYTLSIAGDGEDAARTGDLDITGDVTITGAGADSTIIDGGGLDRVFHVVRSGNRVEISDVTVRNGRSAAVDEWGGGISNEATLTLTNGIVSDNRAENAAGGISNVGTLILNNSTVSGNRVGSWAAGIYKGGTLTLTNSMVSSNRASGQAGGIHNTGTLTLISSTVSRNTAGSDSGGISNIGTLILTNSTISGNSATNGGGIYNRYENNTVTLTNSTVSWNSATDGAGIYNEGGTVNMKNSIVAESTFGQDCFGIGTTVSLGYNLDSDGTCNLTEPTDLPNTAPLLGPLQNNGGPTLTHAMQSGSPAIDAGSCTDIDGNPVRNDQRGVPRPQHPTCDIGAFELE